MPSDKIIQFNDEIFDRFMIKSKIPVMVNFWAQNCGPCRTLAPILDELAEEYGDQVVIGKCDVDSCDDIVAQYRVRNIPTIVFIKGGEVVDKVVGATSKDTLKSKIDAML